MLTAFVEQHQKNLRANAINKALEQHGKRRFNLKPRRHESYRYRDNRAFME
jgi:hypothetical protein